MQQKKIMSKEMLIWRILFSFLLLIVLVGLTIITIFVWKGKNGDTETLALFMTIGWILGLIAFLGIIIPKKLHHFLYSIGLKLSKRSDDFYIEPENLAFKKSRSLWIVSVIFSCLMFVCAILIGAFYF